jgi:hypothetical protein
MVKLLFSLAVFVLAMNAPAFAEDAVKCDEASMATLKAKIDAMNNPALSANKAIAVEQEEMAKKSMGKQNMDECSKHMAMANMGITMKCDDESISVLKTGIDAMKDPAMKAHKNKAGKHLDGAKAALKENRLDDCIVSMGKALVSINKRP